MTQERIARKLKLSPFLPVDRCLGSLRIREVEAWDIGYTVSPDGVQWVVKIWAVELPGELEEMIQSLERAVKSALPDPVQVLLERRRSQ